MSLPKPRAWILLLDRRVALETGDRDEIEEELRQLAQRRQGRLHAERRKARIDPDREVVQGEVEHVARDTPRIVGVVGERLRVGDQDELLVVVLERDAVAQAAAIVAEMERAGRAIAGQDDGARRGVGHGRFSGWEPPRRVSCRDREQACRTSAAGFVLVR